MQRQAIEVVVATNAGPLRVMTTHLEYYSAAHRAAQIRRLRAIQEEVAQNEASPAKAAPSPYDSAPRPASLVLCGDFNLAPDDRRVPAALPAAARGCLAPRAAGPARSTYHRSLRSRAVAQGRPLPRLLRRHARRGAAHRLSGDGRGDRRLRSPAAQIGPFRLGSSESVAPRCPAARSPAAAPSPATRGKWGQTPIFPSPRLRSSGVGGLRNSPFLHLRARTVLGLLPPPSARLGASRWGPLAPPPGSAPRTARRPRNRAALSHCVAIALKDSFVESLCCAAFCGLSRMQYLHVVPQDLDRDTDRRWPRHDRTKINGDFADY